jgi:hypothetical protein
MPWVLAYLPVMMLALDTAQMGVVTNASLKYTPSFASWSMFGVCKAGISG